jgi:hypothetical protein
MREICKSRFDEICRRGHERNRRNRGARAVDEARRSRLTPDGHGNRRKRQQSRGAG